MGIRAPGFMSLLILFSFYQNVGECKKDAGKGVNSRRVLKTDLKASFRVHSVMYFKTECCCNRLQNLNSTCMKLFVKLLRVLLNFAYHLGFLNYNVPIISFIKLILVAFCMNSIP